MKNLIKEKVAETKKRLILEAVSSYFEKEGFAKPTMHDIAKNLGISIGALYKLFPSKDDLFYGYIEYQILLFYNDLIKETQTTKDPKERLTTYITMKFKAFASKRKAIEDPVIGDPLFFVKMNTKKSNPAKPVFEFLANEFEKLSKTFLLKGDDYMKIAYLFNAFTMGYIEYWLNFGGELEKEAGRVFNRFMEGAKA